MKAERALRGVAIAVSLVATTGFAFAVIGGVGTGSSSVVELFWPLPNIAVGTLLTFRRPRLLTGWLFSLIAVLASTGGAAEYAAEVGLAGPRETWWGVAGAWYGEWYWIPLIYVTLIFLPLLFPDGRPPSPRWRPVVGAMTATLGALTVTAALQERLDTIGDRDWTRNPIGITGLGDVEEGAMSGVLLLTSLTFLVIALSSLVVRFRRSRGTERQQLKLFTFAAIVLIVGFVVQGVLDALPGVARLDILDIALFALTPVAASVAILRYRLYAIDRLISRTVTYALLTALLALVYLAAVSVLTSVTSPVTRDSPIAVAASTLVVAALFQPVRRRVQATVDRRFNRAHYDATRTVDSYRARLRDHVDLDRLCSDLVGVTGEALQPRAAALWLRPPKAAP